MVILLGRHPVISLLEQEDTFASPEDLSSAIVDLDDLLNGSSTFCSSDNLILISLLRRSILALRENLYASTNAQSSSLSKTREAERVKQRLRICEQENDALLLEVEQLEKRNGTLEKYSIKYEVLQKKFDNKSFVADTMEKECTSLLKARDALISTARIEGARANYLTEQLVKAQVIADDSEKQVRDLKEKLGYFERVLRAILKDHSIQFSQNANNIAKKMLSTGMMRNRFDSQHDSNYDDLDHTSSCLGEFDCEAHDRQLIFREKSLPPYNYLQASNTSFDQVGMHIAFLAWKNDTIRQVAIKREQHQNRQNIKQRDALIMEEKLKGEVATKQQQLQAAITADQANAAWRIKLAKQVNENVAKKKEQIANERAPAKLLAAQMLANAETLDRTRFFMNAGRKIIEKTVCMAVSLIGTASMMARLSSVYQ